jgi:hypothetical protein
MLAPADAKSIAGAQKPAAISHAFHQEMFDVRHGFRQETQRIPGTTAKHALIRTNERTSIWYILICDEQIAWTPVV